MKRLGLLLSIILLLSACASPQRLSTEYERDQLISVRHNAENEYTLLTYRDALGQMRHVLRRHGIFELSMTHTHAGTVDLKERGQAVRSINAAEVTRLTARLNELLRDALPTSKALTSEV